MSAALILANAPQQGIKLVGCANSFFTGITQASEVGNIASVTGADELRDIYNNSANVAWQGPVTPQIIQNQFTTGQYVVMNAITVEADFGAGYECRRGASLITNNGSLQRAISENNGVPLDGNDARWCIYYPSEDFNQEVIAIQYNTTDPTDPNQGNNIDQLISLTGRMKNFSGNNGPVCTGVANHDLFDDNLSIFAKGCLVTWETSATSGEALMVAVTP